MQRLAAVMLLACGPPAHFSESCDDSNGCPSDLECGPLYREGQNVPGSEACTLPCHVDTDCPELHCGTLGFTQGCMGNGFCDFTCS